MLSTISGNSNGAVNAGRNWQATPPRRAVASARTTLARHSADTPRNRRACGAGSSAIAGEPLPIWLAALVATRCLASRNGEAHDVRWSCVSGRALYTNAGAEPETIQPLGVHLAGGDTLAVYWQPGETAYTMEVLRQSAYA